MLEPAQRGVLSPYSGRGSARKRRRNGAASACRPRCCSAGWALARPRALARPAARVGVSRGAARHACSAEPRQSGEPSQSPRSAVPPAAPCCSARLRWRSAAVAATRSSAVAQRQRTANKQTSAAARARARKAALTGKGRLGQRREHAVSVRGGQPGARARGPRSERAAEQHRAAAVGRQQLLSGSARGELCARRQRAANPCHAVTERSSRREWEPTSRARRVAAPRAA